MATICGRKKREEKWHPTVTTSDFMQEYVVKAYEFAKGVAST